MRRMFAVISILILTAVAGCSGKYAESDPQQVVVRMLRGMENNDREAIAHYLDFPAFLNLRDRDYALQMDSVRTFSNPEQILDDLTKGGFTYTRWMKMQRVVGALELHGDTAYVEVSFIDKEASRQYYNKWGVRRIKNGWKIFSFGTMPTE